MSPQHKPSSARLLQQLTGGLLFLAVLILVGVLSVRYSLEMDWTAGGRNTLTQPSRDQLAAMPDELRFTVFAYSGDELRRAIEADLQRYRREKDNLVVEFIDPSAQPQKVREYNISRPGEFVMEYQGRRETLSDTTEQSITTALQRLAYGGEQWAVFIEGHGERSIADTQGAEAYGKFAEALRDKGLKVQGLNLVKTPQIPDNTGVLVLASPEKALLPGESSLIEAYVRQGGNLLWLADPDHPAGLASLAKALGINWQNGYAILPEYEILGTGHPGFFAAIGYPPNPVTAGFNQVTLFPLVRALQPVKDSGWKVEPLLVSSEAAWLETGPIDGGRVALDPEDIAGPLLIGLTQTRARPAKEGEDPGETGTQRVALVGDADFLSNTYLNELGNRQLGLNLMQWLASRDAQLNIDIPKAPDTALYLPGWATMLIGGGFVVLLPLLLLGLGVTRWLLRRRR
jgi:ABC-type uncharacterized transport system involved in gliding motility auxiliary subunit